MTKLIQYLDKKFADCINWHLYVFVSAEPYVVPFGPSKNLVQNDTLGIECKVLGHPKPHVSWSKGDKAIEVWLLSLYQILY
jgi:hypothetical protein